VHAIKKEILGLRGIVWPLRVGADAILRDGSPLFTAETRLFLLDLLDHLQHAMESLDGARDRLGAALELHIALNGQRLGEVTRVLTLVATIFIPLTFVVGLYGMNFQYMPELTWRWGYPAVLFAMLLMGLGMAVWFRWRRWI
jgi:magnesium transporter